MLSAMTLGLSLVVGVTNGSNTNAKSYGQVVTNARMAMSPENRNVNFTGIYPLYNKASSLKGARVVATAATLDRLANSNVSSPCL